MENINIDIHADDYGYSLNTSKDILECAKKGCLDSISIICNTHSFEESMDLFYKEIPNLPYLPLLSVHINLVEGYSLTKSTLLSINGINTSSWGNLFIGSLGGMKKALKAHAKEEIKAQILKTDEAIKKCIKIAKDNGIECKQKGIRIDSHVHTLPIPLLFKALTEVIEEEKLDVEYIRNPKEPLMPFLTMVSLYPTYNIANFLKNSILNLFSKNIDKYFEKKNYKKMYMWGLVMSGSMDYERVKKIYNKMVSYSKKNGRDLEILFHPGRALETEASEEYGKDYFKNANLSINRKIEKEAVLKIRGIYGNKD